MQCTTVLLLLLAALGASGAAQEAERVKWSIASPEGVTCAIFAAEYITVNLNIATSENTTEPISFAINGTTQVTGDCNGRYKDEPAEFLRISFFPDGEEEPGEQPWRLWLWFTSPDDPRGLPRYAFELTDWTLETSPSSRFNTTVAQNFTKRDAVADDDLDVHASDINGWACANASLALAADSSIHLEDAKVIANAILDTADFPAEQTFEQCGPHEPKRRTPASVPIVVGLCLVALVAAVVVAYFVGRARAQPQGYASV